MLTDVLTTQSEYTSIKCKAPVLSCYHILPKRWRYNRAKPCHRHVTSCLPVHPTPSQSQHVSAYAHDNYQHYRRLSLTTVVPPAHCSSCMLWDAPILQTSNCSLPPPFLSRWTWTERDGCSFRLFERHHDFHLFVQTNPNPYPNPNLNQFMPNPNLNLTSIHTLPLNMMPHRCSAGLLVHLTYAGTVWPLTFKKTAAGHLEQNPFLS